MVRPTDEAATVRVITAAAELSAAEWDRCAGGDGTLDDGRPADPFLQHAFFVALEESGSASPATGWHPRHLVVDGADGRPIGIVPAYAKTHSQGEYVFDHGWAQAWQRAGGRYYPKLQVSVPFTPVTGPRLLVAPGAAAERALVRRTLIAGLETLTTQGKLSSAHATFLAPSDAAAFADAGWSMREDRQYHWPNRGYRDFDDFLATLLGRKRKQILRERREAVAGGIEMAALTGAAIGEADWDAFFAFYMDTGARKWGRPYLNRRFFSMIGESMADRLLLMVARHEGRRIGGALNFIGRDALYGRWWGTVDDRPFLHFEACYYAAIDWAIARGLSRVEAGAQGEHKLARGYLPVATRSAHLIVDPGFRAAVERFLGEETAALAAGDGELIAATPYADRRRGAGDAAALADA
ncbi:N-acetyltransferase [Siculibacillus lacustris]|uniref:N-acetyltransferase n=1 Tax=Siculibacillus lacustris TaxID=1549641 RepID=A0A4Q9VGZ6_9HYPH|nr:GNAT family N-acetyltransferase [Siculibacillus lacustris]TBW34314.1 N-acetyltransferase [Siculibacillus lacustris]